MKLWCISIGGDDDIGLTGDGGDDIGLGRVRSGGEVGVNTVSIYFRKKCSNEGRKWKKKDGICFSMQITKISN